MCVVLACIHCIQRIVHLYVEFARDDAKAFVSKREKVHHRHTTKMKERWANEVEWTIGRKWGIERHQQPSRREFSENIDARIHTPHTDVYYSFLSENVASKQCKREGITWTRGVFVSMLHSKYLTHICYYSQSSDKQRASLVSGWPTRLHRSTTMTDEQRQRSTRRSTLAILYSLSLFFTPTAFVNLTVSLSISRERKRETHSFGQTVFGRMSMCEASFHWMLAHSVRRLKRT